MGNVREQALDAREECEIARRILALEAEVRALLVDLPTCREVLESRGSRASRTRAADVNRIEAALAAATVLARSSRTVASARVLWAEARDLRWRLAISATRVVYREAHRLRSNPTVDPTDLVQEGFFGLLDAAKRFEPDQQVRFRTYARWWVRAHMTRAIDLGRMVHLSAAACEQLRNLRKQIRIYEMAGTDWSAGELAADLGLDLERVRLLLGVGVVKPLVETTDDEVAEVCLVDEALPLPDELAAHRQRLEGVHEAIATVLDDRKQAIVRKRYGLDGEEKSTAQIARGMRLSRERVRQLEHESIGVLRRACAAAAEGRRIG